jgi:hypothetical protein
MNSGKESHFSKDGDGDRNIFKIPIKKRSRRVFENISAAGDALL